MQHRTQRLGGGSRFNKGVVRAIDAATFGASFMTLSFTTHQAWLVWSTKDASGVSVLLWIALMLSSIIWSLYGYVHRERVIVVVHFLWIILSAVIIVGVVSFS